ncbi:type II toxin-antitoxin system CcdA family antitoxin [Aeromonas caviae]|nr:type II toxin-antitoxin system CcdA family antitoxin [Aeromonas caviae]MDH0939227.1 type II toxin-antitoxin system CcdA family antitoxin [Aeromonas caviae]
MQVDVAHEAWQGAQVEAALSEADAGDFLPEKEMAEKLNQLGKRNKVEMDGWAQENHEAIQELNRIVEEHGLLSDDLSKAEQIMERVCKGEEVLHSLDDVERELSRDAPRSITDV